jgi:hypothetical protein
MEELRNMHKILVGKPQRMRPLRRLRYIWEDNIKMDLKETGWSVYSFIWLRIGTSGELLQTK